MSTQRTSDEVLMDYKARLGDEAGHVYHQLFHDYYWLRVKWQEYVALFGISPRRVDILNMAASNLFGLVESVMWDDLLLHVARMTDKPRTRDGKENLTFKSLLRWMPPGKNQRRELSTLIAAAETAAAFARDHRHRRIAHRDLDVALNTPAKPLAPTSRLHMRAVLDAFHAVLDCVHSKFLDSYAPHPEISLAPGSSEALMRVVYAGVRAERERFERGLAGAPTPEDLAVAREIAELLRHRPSDSDEY